MTHLEALVCMSQTVLRARNEWHGTATIEENIDRAVYQCSDLLFDGSRELCDAAIAELSRRTGKA